MSASADRQLLFALLALQNHFLTLDDLLGVFRSWLGDKSQSLDAILVERRLLSPQVHQLLLALVQEHLRQHDNDAAKSLASLSSLDAFHYFGLPIHHHAQVAEAKKAAATATTLINKIVLNAAARPSPKVSVNRVSTR